MQKIKYSNSEIAMILIQCIASNHFIFISGNGGSAADAQHFTCEVLCRNKVNRRALPCICLNADISTITAIANDFSYDLVFSRQIEALGRDGDVFIAISTSGNSKNILSAIIEAKRRRMVTIGLLGRDGGEAGKLVDYSVIVEEHEIAKIQEKHIAILHSWADAIEDSIIGK